MLILAAGLLLGAAAPPATEPVVSPPSSPEQLVLTLDTPRNAVVLYEPVPLAYRVKNPTTDVITSSISLSGIEFVVTGPDGKAATHRASRILGHAVLEAVTHDPGSTVLGEGELGWRGEDGPFPATGAYEIRARVYAGGRPTPVYIESNPVRIEVRLPSPLDSKAIASFPSEADFKRLLSEGATTYCEGRNGPACFEDLRRFIDNFGDSAYAPKVLRNLADTVANGRLGVQPKYEIAVQLYERFLERWPSHPNAPSVMYCLAMTLDQAGRSGDAAEVILAFEKRFPEQRAKAEALRTNLRSGQVLPPKP